MQIPEFQTTNESISVILWQSDTFWSFYFFLLKKTPSPESIWQKKSRWTSLGYRKLYIFLTLRETGTTQPNRNPTQPNSIPQGFRQVFCVTFTFYPQHSRSGHRGASSSSTSTLLQPCACGVAKWDYGDARGVGGKTGPGVGFGVWGRRGVFPALRVKVWKELKPNDWKVQVIKGEETIRFEIQDLQFGHGKMWEWIAS